MPPRGSSFPWCSSSTSRAGPGTAATSSGSPEPPRPMRSPWLSATTDPRRMKTTRPRDRLYLSTALKDGRVQAGRGSLAEVLPASLLDTIAQAQLSDGRADWTEAGGTVHRFQVVSRPPEHTATPEAHAPTGLVA